MARKLETAKEILKLVNRRNWTKGSEVEGLVGEVFDFAMDNHNIMEDGLCNLILLTTSGGHIIKGRIADGIDTGGRLRGLKISLDKLPNDSVLIKLYDYCMILDTHVTDDSMERLRRDLICLIRIVKRSAADREFITEALDSIKTAISIYDNNANVVYANYQFFNDLFIKDAPAQIGKNINDILIDNEISISSIDERGHGLKMMEVLKQGKEVLDWEVRVASLTNQNKSRITSNDMYPIKDNAGKVLGMIELNRSRQQDISKAQRFVGLSADYTFDSIIGMSPKLRDTIKTAKRYADNPFNMLITGESGVGKELFAQSVHNSSSRRNGPFVALNCSSFPENLIESELFGYVGGAFTGASKKGQIGKFELADKGTLFLDEIGELPYHFQAKILRTLETWKITRIGSNQPVPVNVRLIAATNRNLEEMVEKGLFREDLYYRLEGLHLIIPPLRERGDDVILLAEHYLESAPGYGIDSELHLDESAKEVMLRYNWPGNVRELKNIVNRASVLATTDVVTGDVMRKAIFGNNAQDSQYQVSMYDGKPTLPNTAQLSEGGLGLDGNAGAASAIGADQATEAGSEWELLPPEERLARRNKAVNDAHANLIKEALIVAEGKVTQAANLLDVSRKTMYRLMEKYNIDSQEFRNKK